MNQILGNDVVLHAPFWLAWIIIMNAGDSNGFGYFTQVRHNILFPLIISTAFNVMYFYGNAFWLTPKYYHQNKWLRYSIALIVFSLAFLLLKTGAEWLYIDLFLPDLQDVPFTSLGAENVYSLPAFLIGSLIYWAYRKNKKEKEWLLKEKLERELALMKAQMSPHFLFNALNNLYSLGLQGDQKMVTTGILKLSDLLRYVLYESQSEKISLAKELDHISDFVEVNKLMLSKEMRDQVVYKINGDTGPCLIPPMILMAFVENAFKYGMGNGVVDIQIMADVQSTRLIFEVKNKVFKAHEDRQGDSGGIGLKNVKKQLSLLYPSRHELTIQEENDYFKVKLEIELA